MGGGSPCRVGTPLLDSTLRHLEKPENRGASAAVVPVLSAVAEAAKRVSQERGRVFLRFPVRSPVSRRSYGRWNLEKGSRVRRWLQNAKVLFPLGAAM